MKLLFCTNCKDVKMLLPHTRRYCFCRLSFGRYLKNGKARYGGPAVLIAIDDRDIEDLSDKEGRLVHKVYKIKEVASTVEYVPLSFPIIKST